MGAVILPPSYNRRCDERNDRKVRYLGERVCKVSSLFNLACVSRGSTAHHGRTR